jgi:branched-chain amino acid transport system substrate-binding protein
VGVPASQATQQAGLIYWEDGSVATMLTQKGSNNIFRTVTSGQTLGRTAAAFAANVIAPKLHITRHKLRVAVIHIVDIYGSSVAAAQIAGTRALGMNLIKIIPYYATSENWPKMVRELKQARPNVVLVAAYLQDAVAFRRETIRQNLHVGAMVGTSSSFCMMPFAHALGKGAIGLFASDKPDTTINEKALLPPARALRHRVVRLFRQEEFGSSMSGPAVAGFVGGWVLFHNVLPRATRVNTAGIRRAALAVNLPYGSEINGAGVRFAGPNAPDAGQNLRATSVIWQWQHVDKAVILWPHAYANGRPRFIPLPLQPR